MSTPLRIGIVGFDHPHVLRYAPMLAAREDASLAWIAAEGTNAEFGRRMAATLDVPFLSTPTHDVDAAYVATVPAEHLAVVEALAPAGIHILLDKPMAITMADARAIDRLAREAGIRLMVPFNPRGQLGPRAVKERIDRGELGEVRLVHAVKVGRVPLSIAGLDPAWLVDPALAGFGGFGDIGIHALDALRWLIGREAVRVHARIHAGVRPDLPVDSIGTAIITWEGGAISTLTAGWANPDGSPVSLDARFEVVGTRAAALVEHPYRELRVADGQRSERLAAVRDDAVWVLGSFIDSVVRGVDPPIGGEDGMRALELLLACYESSRTGGEVALG